jgi:hypothetical protein
MSTQTYIGLDNSANWFCNKCESPNSLNSIYQSIHIDSLSNQNSLLNSTNFPENGNSSLNNLGSPIASSSPKKGGKYKIKININFLRVRTGNFQSARSKSHETALLIESSNPDIIIGTETLLKPGIYDSEVIPPSYTLYRNDRADGYAGVLLAVKSHITSSEYSKSKNIEFIAAKIQLSKQKSLIIGSYYRPPNKTDDIYINKTVEEFSSLCNNNKSATVWIRGDFNLSDIDWPSENITGTQYKKSLSKKYLDLFRDTSLEQVINFPTRNTRTLDMFLTNKPSLVNMCKPLPGLSDHDIVLTDNKNGCKCNKQITRNIYLWKTTNIDEIKSDTIQLSNKITCDSNSSSKNKTDIEEIRNQLKQGISRIQNKHVPQKQTSS